MARVRDSVLMTDSELQLSEKYLQSIVNEAKKQYKTKTSRLIHCALLLGGMHYISNPDVFYKKYFEEEK